MRVMRKVIMWKLLLSVSVFVVMIALLTCGIYALFYNTMFFVTGGYVSAFSVITAFASVFICVIISIILRKLKTFPIEFNRKAFFLVFPLLCVALLSQWLLGVSTSIYSVNIYIICLIAYLTILFAFVFRKKVMFSALLSLLFVCTMFFVIKDDMMHKMLYKTGEIDLYEAMLMANIASVTFLSSFAAYFITDKAFRWSKNKQP